MNGPATTPVNVTLTVTADAKGNPQYAWSGSHVDSSGNLDLSKILTPIVVTITISTSIQISFCTPASQTMWLGKQSNGKPTGPYVGSEFTAPAFVNNSVAQLQWTDQNSDGVTYEYVLLLWLVNAANPGGTRVQLDPRIVNRGNSK